MKRYLLNLLMRWTRIDIICSPPPFTLTNGTPDDATQVMSIINQIISNVNANAADLGASNIFSQPQTVGTPTAAGHAATKNYVDGAVAGYQPLNTALLKSNNLSDVANPATSRSNLGLGSAAVTTYDSGTWTPSLGGTATYSGQVGTYIKIGKKVFVEGYIIVNTIGTGSTTDISGLPYTSKNSGQATGSVSFWSSAASSLYGIFVMVVQGSNSLELRGVTAATASISTPPIFGNGTWVIFSAAYEVP